MVSIIAFLIRRIVIQRIHIFDGLFIERGLNIVFFGLDRFRRHFIWDCLSGEKGPLRVGLVW